MILTVTLNAAIDRTYRVESFRLDAVHRPSACWIVAGGKGINVARTVKRLGGEARATGILAGHNGRFIAGSLRAENIRGSFVWVRGESRTCIAAVDPVHRTQTEINETGPTVPPSAAGRLIRRVRRMIEAEATRYLVLSGSIPPGMPNDVYARITEEARRAGVHVVLDSSGEPLRRGAAVGPWMIKPNLLELEHLTGKRVSRPEEAASVARGLLSPRTEAVVVTMGSEGCVCVSERQCFHVAAPEVPFVSSVGSGDALLGALLWALVQGWDWRAAVRYGVGAGAANVCEYGAGFVDPAKVERFARSATLREL